MNHGHWYECQCPVVHSGGERECISSAGYYSEQVNEPAVRVRHENVSPNCYSSPYSLCENPDQILDPDDEDEKIVVPENHIDQIVVPRKFGHVFSKEFRKPTREFAMMAPCRQSLPTNKVYDLAKERGLLTVDNGATSTLTRSLFNMSDVSPRITNIQLAGQGMSITSTHVGYKTYYVEDATGTIRPIKTMALFVPKLEEDLLAGRALVKSKYRIIMDDEDEISGIFPVVNGEIDPATRFPFAESDGLFYVETIPLSETKYKSMSGWHKRMSHAPIQAIKATIPHSKGSGGSPDGARHKLSSMHDWEGPSATVPKNQGACEEASRASIYGYHDVIGHFD